MKVDKEYYLYILMRIDMASMNPGKAMAQSAHAANQFVKNFFIEDKKELELWQKQGNGFGTTIVLSVDEKTMRHKIELAELMGLNNGIVRDETYPLEDGCAFHTFSVDTCAYVFMNKNDPRCETLLGDLDLHE